MSTPNIPMVTDEWSTTVRRQHIILNVRGSSFESNVDEVIIELAVQPVGDYTVLQDDEIAPRPLVRRIRFTQNDLYRLGF